MFKRKWKIILFIAVISICIVGGMMVYAINELNKATDSLSELEIFNSDLSDILSELEDGTYTGKYEASKFLSVTVRVEIKEHEIINVDILEHSNGKGEPAEIITDKVVKNQSLNVDAISGATASSKVILKAIENAIMESEKRDE